MAGSAHGFVLCRADGKRQVLAGTDADSEGDLFLRRMDVRKPGGFTV